MMSVENVETNELYGMLPVDVCRELQKHETSMTVPQGTALIEHGMLPGGLVILNSGTVKISVPCPRRPVVTTGQAGRVFGMRTAISGELPEIDVVCLESCRVTFVPRDVFLACLQLHPEIYFAVARVLSHDLQIAHHILRSTSRSRRRVPADARIHKPACN
jgi:CRP-like cAMP-binding protein